jgi:hypothetical protein
MTNRRSAATDPARSPGIVGAALLAAGLVLLLIAVAPFVARLILGGERIDHQGLVIGSPLGCAGLVGCAAARCWLVRGGSGWSGSLGWVGGCANLAGAALCLIADTDHGGWDDPWNGLADVLLGLCCSLVGCLLMLIGAIAMSLRPPASGQDLGPAVRSSAVRPAGGR